MVVKLEIDKSLTEDEIIIRCRELSSEVREIESLIADSLKKKSFIIFYKDDKEYYLNLNSILFIETDVRDCYAHTIDDTYQVKFRLYELEELLPKCFVRISKSAIVNVNHILLSNSEITEKNSIANVVSFYLPQ